ncbi:MAG: hypothetical protein JNK60_19910 [Acidobacteria bacterium]|nr:hypothetical protein [Acidobacteriota bacterium]
MSRWLLALAVFLVPAPPLRAVAKNVGGIEVTVADNPSSRVTHGYQALRVRLRNTGTSEARVTLAYPASHQENVYWDRLESTSRTYTLAPQTTVESSFYIPDVPVSGTGLLVTAPKEKAVLDLLLAGAGNAYAAPVSFRIVASRSVSKEALETALQPREIEGPPDPSRGSVLTVGATTLPFPPVAPLPGGGSAPTPTIFPVERWEEDAATWPAEWIAYSSVDAVVLAAADAARLRPEARDALLSFTEAGGVLAVFGAFETPRGWREDPGNGTLRSFRAGFGRAFLVDAATPAALGPFVLEPVAEAIVKTATTLNADRVPASAAWAELPRLPARALFVVLLVIMITIGPLNIAVLARKRRPMLLYATVPAVAIFSSLSLVGYALSNEGLARSVTRSLLTLLDESAQRAVTIGWTGYYTTFTPGGGLLFSPLTELGSTGEPWQWGRQPKRLAVDFTEGQRLARGFVEARVPARFSVRHVEPRRERLVFAREGSAWVVTNGLGVDLAELWLNPPSGGLCGATSVRAGQKAALTAKPPGEALSAALELDVRDVFATSWEALEGRMSGAGPQLRPGTWLARVARSPFLADGLDVRTRKETSYVLGTSPVLPEGLP